MINNTDLKLDKTSRLTIIFSSVNVADMVYLQRSEPNGQYAKDQEYINFRQLSSGFEPSDGQIVLRH